MAKKSQYKKKRKFNLGRPAANTKIGDKRVRKVRVRGGNFKFRALRLDSGNFSWGSESVSRKSRVLDVVYNATNNEMVRTKTLVKNSIIQIDATPFKNWYENQYSVVVGRKKKEVSEETSKPSEISESGHPKTPSSMLKTKLDSHIEDQLHLGKLYACIASRPGQCGRCDGYILEGKELEFYVRKIKARKAK
ncbi:hypothetical protein MXB_1517 [Myxobolus squamalis]|nr:hypothetical protein MXB_1517 [Myxobolus squamalis]